MAAALAGYVLSRTTGLPNAADYIGNWGEPIGVANVFIEAAVIAVGVPAHLLATRATAGAGRPTTASSSAARTAGATA